MDNLNRHIINRLQKNLPICDRPYQAVAEELGTTENELLSRLQTMLDDGLLTRFGPMFNAQEMGGALSLCAMSVPAENFDTVAATVNALPQVAHNYEREHELNMWFVLATATPNDLQQTLVQIEQNDALIKFDEVCHFYTGK